MSIRDKLSRLDTTPPSDPPAPEPTEEWISDLERELAVGVIRRDRSFILLKESYFPLEAYPEFRRLRSCGFEAPRLADMTGPVSEAPINLRKALFLDTETTGLMGGTGTYAFLVGVGFLELNHVVVRQYLLPEFSSEWIMLEQLNRLFSAHAYTVSFNGKTFDLPLLRTRYILNRQTPLLEDIEHLDLLHAARRIWRLALPSCDLQTLERHALGVERTNDVPGAYVPQIYFEFIRKREAWLLRDVLEHNYYDIVNMVLLTLKLSAIAVDPLEHLDRPLERFSLARHYAKQRRYEASNRLLRAVIDHPESGRDLAEKSLFLLSMNCKRSGNIEMAREHLDTLIERQVLRPSIIEELAKICEHRDKAFRLALELVNKGISYLEVRRELGGAQEAKRWLPPLQHRKRRLERKLAKED